MSTSGIELAKVGYNYLGTPYSVMDCQAFVEKCLSDCGLRKDLKGSNAWYRKVLSEGWVGTPEECKKKFGYIPAGAFLFIWDNNGGEVKRGYHDGLGDASHIGIYTGTRQGAIHSSSKMKCVAESRFTGKTINGGWNRVGLWSKILYDIKVNQMINAGNSCAGESATSEGGQKKMEKATVVLTSGSKGSTVNLRKGAGQEYDILARVPVGTVVDVTEDLGQWCKIQTQGYTGYMMSNFLEYPGGGEEISGDLITLEEREQIDNALLDIENRLETIRTILGRG